MTNGRSLVHVVGIYFFTKGFLSTRLILNEKSSCEISPIDLPERLTVHSTQEGCWYPKKFERAVVIVIDALRYDFVVPFVPTNAEGDDGPRNFHNAFPVLYDTARAKPEQAFLLPFIADPPTTTLQRLKGLMTGSLPTFIDAGSNFAGTAIEEDNLLAQMRSLNKTLVHLGDDTWQALFPGFFHENLSHPLDSFNVWDLHTVDNGVLTHLMPLMQSEKASWDVIFGHFLGVDHAGHRYGPDHPAMRDKLQQMNGAVIQMMESLSDDTVLVIMGDHGMDTKGDHGGESDDEVEAALWIYSSRPTFGRTQQQFEIPPADAKTRPVRQTDLVSTLSLLLGLPIPFNNIGAPIEEAFAESGDSDCSPLARVHSIAAAQIYRYQEEYSKARDLKPSPEQRSLYDSAQLLMAAAPKKGHDQMKVAYSALRVYEESVLDVYRKLWANFDIPDMIMGVSMLATGLLSLSFFTSTNELPFGGIGSTSGLVVTGGLIFATGVKMMVSGLGGLLFAIVVLISTCGFAITSNSDITLSIWFSLLPRNLWSWMALVFTVSQAAGFASNSYTIHEDTILLFFLTTFGFSGVVSSLRQWDPSDQLGGVTQSVLFAVLTRIASVSRLCREEQMPGCRSTFYSSSSSSVSAPWQIALPFAIAIFLPEFIKIRYKGTASYVGLASFWNGFCFRVGLLLIAAYWMLDAADNGGWLQHIVDTETLRTTSIALSRCTIGIAIVVGTVLNLWTTPCVDIESIAAPESKDAPVSTEAKPVIIVLGYANLHGTRYFFLLPAFILLISILLPPMGQFSLAICAAQILCLAEILDHNGLIPDSSSFTSLGPVLLAMLGSFHFFKTGHQATLASIQWNAAFVPFKTVTYPWSPLLVILNSFGPQILCAAAVPLTVLWKRPVDRESGWLARIQRDVWRAVLSHMFYYSVIQLATTLWAGHLRRHLMLYRVFMPKFLMASVLLVIIDLVLLIVCWPMFWVNTLSVRELVGS